MSVQSRLVVAAGLIWLEPDRLLVQRRPDHAEHGAGLLELPGGKVEPGESPPEALRRELIEEWGPEAAALEIGRVAELLHHVYPPPGPEVLLCVYHVDGRVWRQEWRTRIDLEPGASAETHRLVELPREDFLAGDRRFVDALVRGEIRSPLQSK